MYSGTGQGGRTSKALAAGASGSARMRRSMCKNTAIQGKGPSYLYSGFDINVVLIRVRALEVLIHVGSVFAGHEVTAFLALGHLRTTLVNLIGLGEEVPDGAGRFTRPKSGRVQARLFHQRLILVITITVAGTSIAIGFSVVVAGTSVVVTSSTAAGTTGSRCGCRAGSGRGSTLRSCGFLPFSILRRI